MIVSTGATYKRSQQAALILCLIASPACAQQIPRELQVLADQTREERIDTEAQLRALYDVVLRFHRGFSNWPANLNATCDPSPDDCLLDAGETPVDSWGSAISYVTRPEGFELRSSGPDRKSGTSDDLVVVHPLDRIVARGIAGCYRPTEGWWTSSRTMVRLDTLPSTLFANGGSYSLQIDLPLPPDETQWFPVGADSILVEWAFGPHLEGIRFKRVGDALRGRVDVKNLDSRGWTEWRGVLTLVRTRCQV